MTDEQLTKLVERLQTAHLEFQYLTASYTDPSTYRMLFRCGRATPERVLEWMREAGYPAHYAMRVDTRMGMVMGAYWKAE